MKAWVPFVAVVFVLLFFSASRVQSNDEKPSTELGSEQDQSASVKSSNEKHKEGEETTMTKADLVSSPIVVEQIYTKPIETVWKAITVPEQMKQWFFEPIRSFKPEVGFETRFDVVTGEKKYPHLWKVVEVVADKKLVLDWRYGGYPGYSTVEFLLTPRNGGTKLTLTHKGIENFPQDDPNFSRESGLAGWNYFICKSLKKFLEQ